MIEFLKQIDVSLFYFFNVSMSNAAFDKLMPFITEFKHWLPIYLLSSIYLIYKQKKRGLIILILIILTVAISDQIGFYIKDAVGRLRPCWQFSDINILVPCGQGKSFPSNHAINNFGASIILSYFFRSKAKYFYILAIFVSFSRVYIGVHFPLDLLGGAVLGSLVGMGVIMLHQKLQRVEKFKVWLGEE